MDLWMKIGWAILVGLMLLAVFPQARQMVRDSPQGTARDWLSALIPIALALAFVVFLTVLV